MKRSFATFNACGTPAARITGEINRHEPVTDMVDGGPFRLQPGQWT